MTAVKAPKLQPLKGGQLELIQKAIRKGEEAARTAMEARQQRQEMEMKSVSFRF